MSKAPQMISVMTAFPHSVERSADLRDTHASMRELDIRHLPVTEAGALVGIVTDRDIRQRLGGEAGATGADGLRVADVFVEDAYVVEADQPVAAVVQTMADRHIGSAIVTRKGKLVGIFTSTDVCACYAQELRRLYTTPPGDTVA